MHLNWRIFLFLHHLQGVRALEKCSRWLNEMITHQQAVTVSASLPVLAPLTVCCPQSKHPSDLFHPHSRPRHQLLHCHPEIGQRLRFMNYASQCVCVHSIVEHRRHDAVLLFAITQGFFLLYPNIFQGEVVFFSLNIFMFCFKQRVVEFWRAPCYTFCFLQNIT